MLKKPLVCVPNCIYIIQEVNHMKRNLVLDYSLIDIIGEKKFYVLFKNIFVAECQNAGLTQRQTLIKLNEELEAQGQKKNTLSLIKYLWK